MYSKVFQQIFDSSISEDHVVRHIFMDLLVLADRHGEVDMTIFAISRRTNVPLEAVRRAIERLTEPDPDSRTDVEEGRRLILIDHHRDWGWRIVNFAHYNAMRNEDARREYFREYKAKRRAERKINTLHENVLDRSGQSTVSTHTPTDAPTHTDTNTPLNPHAAGRVSDVDRCFESYPKQSAPSASKSTIARGIQSLAAERFSGNVEAAGEWLYEKIKQYASSTHIKTIKPQFIPSAKNWVLDKRYDDDPKQWDIACRGDNSSASFTSERDQLFRIA